MSENWDELCRLTQRELAKFMGAPIGLACGRSFEVNYEQAMSEG
jgi:hypothetical protein